jgi:hypothetical protein
MIVFTPGRENRLARRARIRVWGLLCSLCAMAIFLGWLGYARLSRSADFVEERFNYKLLEDPRWQDIVWDKCDPSKKDAELRVTYTSGDASFRLSISIANGKEGVVQIFSAQAAQADATPVAIYRYHQRALTATQSALAPEDRAWVQRAALAICDFLRKSL